MPPAVPVELAALSNPLVGLEPSSAFIVVTYHLATSLGVSRMHDEQDDGNNDHSDDHDDGNDNNQSENDRDWKLASLIRGTDHQHQQNPHMHHHPDSSCAL